VLLLDRRINSVEDTPAESLFSVSPNPAEETFTIRWSEQSFINKLEIYDLTGSLVADLTGAAGRSAGQAEFSRSALGIASGAYFVECNVSGRTFRQVLFLK
jgi:hypothetical protein